MRSSSEPPSVLAFDIGTSELKAGLVAADGRLLASARAPYGISLDSASGSAEQDPEWWWAALSMAIHNLVQASSIPIVAVCGVGQGPTLVAVDADGRAVRPAITWLDSRGTTDAADLERATGTFGWSLGILPAARWYERHEPRAARRTRWYLNSWEWAMLRLTGVPGRTHTPGQPAIEPARAAAGGVNADRLPPLIAAGAVVGGLSASAAAELGLVPGTAVLAGTVDSFASFHGSGLLDAGDAIDTGGTSGGLAVYWDSAVEIPNAWVAPAPLPGRWIAGGAMTSTGKALDWFAEDVLRAGEPSASLVEEAAAIEPGAGGLVFLPYLAGERSPIWDPKARGAFVGLTLGHRRPHLVRAILEGAALALRHVATPILEAGLRITELRVTGGTARHEAWNQIKADVVGVPVAVPEVLDAALMGAAILAAPGVGWHADTATAIRAMVRIDHRRAPRAENKEAYDALYDAYVSLWPAIEPTVHRLRSLRPPVAHGA